MRRGSTAVVVDFVAEGNEGGRSVVSGGETLDENDDRATSDTENSRLSVGRVAEMGSSPGTMIASGGGARCGAGSGSSGGAGMWGRMRSGRVCFGAVL
jgi:hypothetical protein